jgi:hypothetical protein
MTPIPLLQGTVVPNQRGLTQIGLTRLPLQCPTCNQPCVELMVVPTSAIGRSQDYRIVRCLNCLFASPFYVYHRTIPIRIVAVGQPHGLMAEMGNDPVSASVLWQPCTNGRPLTGWDTIAGETPAWLQPTTPPVCPECGEAMAFILQLATDTLDRAFHELDTDFYIQIEYGATLYFFYCHTCHVSASLTQST